MESIAPPRGPGFGPGEKAGRLIGQPRLADGRRMDDALRDRFVLVTDLDPGPALPRGLALLTPGTAPDAADHLARPGARAALRPDRHTLGTADTPEEMAAPPARTLPDPILQHQPEMA